MLTATSFSLGFATTPHTEVNPCAGAKPYDAQFTDADGVLDESRTITDYFNNRNCAEMMDTGFAINLPQAGMDVTAGGGGELEFMDGGVVPILEDYSNTDLCPVNVHWHLGAEHKSAGQYDETGSGPGGHTTGDMARRKLAQSYDETAEDGVRLGLQCHHYDETDSMYTTPYDFKYCHGMEVGQTYEVHWPHSAAGMCGTKWQYQYPFYDGVFCTPGVISLGDEPPFNVPATIGVQGQVFVIVNSDDAEYANDDLFHGAWQDESHWVDVAKYIGSTTGTTRDNEVCSMYSPITWQVDRTCHKVSASSFDMMCKMMMEQADDMYEDTHPHGARELVAPEWAIDTIYRKK